MVHTERRRDRETQVGCFTEFSGSRLLCIFNKIAKKQQTLTKEKKRKENFVEVKSERDKQKVCTIKVIQVFFVFYI